MNNLSKDALILITGGGGFIGGHLIGELIQKGHTHCCPSYFSPSPKSQLVWPFIDFWRRAATAPTERLKIVMMGALGGTSTLAGLYFLAREKLPHLDVLFAGQFEIHICGSGELPPELERRFQRPDVFVRGFVDDIISELLSCDVFLIPTPIELGSRVRIAYAWSVGCCVVSHSADANGLEEMQDGQNALLASSGLEVAKAIVRTHREPDMRQTLQNNGRETFERYYSETATVDKIITKVEDIIQSSRFASRSDSLGKQSEVGI
jgi:glycosyltransferase involved in cell wall biosynthesis